MIKRLLKIAMVIFGFIISTSLFAQKRIITGKVFDSSNYPLIGVSVVAKSNPTNATLTNKNGVFSIKAATGDTLVFSYVGYTGKEIPVGPGDNLNISLNTSFSNLSDVVVIGYGSVRKKDLTGSIATISEKDFQKGTFTTPEQMIAGKIPGVSIISNSGQPGSGSTIRIRGGSSLNASNDPLIVIDGVPMDNEVVPGQTGAIAGAGSPLSFIDPNDIETFTVLKDASAAAIYGTRASNGVILITTKKGKSGALKINLNSVNSLSTITKHVDVLSAAQFRSVVNANGTAAQIAMMGTASTNWQNEIYQNGAGTNNNVSISGGIKNLPYRLSLGYQDQDGVLITDNLKKTSASLALNPTFFDNHLKVDINVMGSFENTRFANTGAIGGAISFDPTQPVYNTKSTRFGGYYEWLDPTTTTGLVNRVGRNPVGLLNQTLNTATPERSIGNIQLDYKFHFLPELHANVNDG